MQYADFIANAEFTFREAPETSDAYSFFPVLQIQFPVEDIRFNFDKDLNDIKTLLEMSITLRAVSQKIIETHMIELAHDMADKGILTE